MMETKKQRERMRHADKLREMWEEADRAQELVDDEASLEWTQRKDALEAGEKALRDTVDPEAGDQASGLLALLDRLEAAERALDRVRELPGEWRKLQARHGFGPEAACLADDCADEIEAALEGEG